MPESTPIYGITYPCATDVIDAAAFQTFANDVDSAIATVNAVSTDALNRPAARIINFGMQALVNGASTAAIYDTEVFDNDGMANLGVSNDRLTVQTAGTYLVMGNTRIDGAPIQSASVGLFKNGTINYRAKEGDATGFLQILVGIAGVFDAVPGDFFQAFLIYRGGGAGNATFTELSARMVNRP